MADRARVFVPLAFAALAAGCSSAHAQREVVPWVDRPLPHYSAPQPSLVRYSTSAPPCKARQLHVLGRRDGVATGHRFEEFVFTNTSTKTCLLRGYPKITAQAPDGRRIVLHARLGGTFAGQLLAADIEPGRRVLLNLGTSDCGCTCLRPHPIVYRHLEFGLPEGGSVPGGRVTLIKDCYLEMSRFGLPRHDIEPQAEFGTPGTLIARTRSPLSAKAGTVLHYTVELTNPTNRTVTLSPCPGYTESVYTPSAHTSRSFRLNCDAIHSIPPHGHARYAMKLEIPRRASGDAKLGWSLNTPTGPFAAALPLVQILAA
jgi:hypothetical protein